MPKDAGISKHVENAENGQRMCRENAENVLKYAEECAEMCGKYAEKIRKCGRKL